MNTDELRRLAEAVERDLSDADAWRAFERAVCSDPVRVLAMLDVIDAARAYLATRPQSADIGATQPLYAALEELRSTP